MAPGGRPPPRIKLAEPDIGEEECAAVRAAMLSGVLTNGPRTAAFEDAFARMHGVDHAVAMANGTVALAAVYIGLGIGAGDEVIVPSMTFISSATSVLHVGATPVFADIRPDTFNLDAEDVARRVTARTRAILAVHYGGQPADMDELRAVADDAGVLLIEDAAQAHGSTYKGRPVGGLGAAAMFSMTPTKNITTGEGGVVTTDDPDLAARLRLLRNHGQTAPYEHAMLGFNWRITEMQAAMGIVQLGKLPRILDTKRANAERLGASIVDVRTQDAREPVEPAGFDRILLDAPCSDLGTLQSRPDARWRKSPDGIGELAALQRELLEAALKQLRPGGTLVYSTCTISAEEQVEALPGTRAEPAVQLLPQRDGTDGFFIARFTSE